MAGWQQQGTVSSIRADVSARSRRRRCPAAVSPSPLAARSDRVATQPGSELTGRGHTSGWKHPLGDPDQGTRVSGASRACERVTLTAAGDDRNACLARLRLGVCTLDSSGRCVVVIAPKAHKSLARVGVCAGTSTVAN